jgi:glycosyltransferase involved in cell wall biosynthesis
MASRPCRSLIMVGTHHLTMGGIATVVRGYRDAGLFNRYRSAYVVTHVDGPGWRKALVAIKALLRFAWLAWSMPAPLVHIHLSSRASFWRKSVICVLSMASCRPYLLHMHGSEFMQFHDRESGPLTRAFIRFCFARAASILALSVQWRDNLLGICPQACVEVLPNAVPVPATGAPERPVAPAVNILFLGRLGRRKGTHDLVEAFARIAHEHPDARLICAGDGEVAAIAALAVARGVGARVSCPGWLDVDAARRELQKADVFVLPSYAEGVPMALLEAMAQGLPVVTTPVGGIPQVVGQDNGVLVTPGDVAALAAALDGLLCDGARRRRLGERARETIRSRYSLTTAIEHLGTVYRRYGLEPLAGEGR